MATDTAAARKRLFDKCFYYWDVDKRGGVVSLEEISGILVTYKGGHADALCARWSEALRSTFTVDVRHRQRQKGRVEAEAFRNLLAEEMERCPFVLQPTRAGWEGWRSALAVRSVDGRDAAPAVDAEMERYERAKACVTLHLENVPPTLLGDTEEALFRLLAPPADGGCPGDAASPLGNPTSPTPPADASLHTRYDVCKTERASSALPCEGLTKAQARDKITELTSILSYDEVEVFTQHVVATLDFVYDISHRNKRSRMLFESFKFWDNKDRGFIAAEDFGRRMQTTKFVQDNPTHHINHIVDGVVQDPSLAEISLDDYKNVMNRIFLEINEQEADGILRSIRRQLKGDDDTKDERYASCRFLRTEAERKAKKSEAQAKQLERKQSFDHQMRVSTESEMTALRIDRLESKLRHAFDAVTFDDITCLLESTVAPPSARAAYAKVASAVCILLDLPPLIVDGRADYWAAVAAELKSDMVGFLSLIKEYNLSTLSHVRICHCMAALQDHSYPSHMLPVSWFLSSLSEWVRALCECVCVKKNWEWPPPVLQANASNFGQAQIHTQTARCPTVPTSAGAATSAVKTSRTRANATKSAGIRRASDAGLQNAPVPESPFRANNLFYRRRKPGAGTYKEFIERLSSQQRKLERNAAAEEAEQQGGGAAAADGAVVVACGNLRDQLRTDTEVHHYQVLQGLNESLGLPHQAPMAYADHPSTATRPYWADDR